MYVFYIVLRCASPSKALAKEGKVNKTPVDGVYQFQQIKVEQMGENRRKNIWLKTIAGLSLPPAKAEASRPWPLQLQRKRPVRLRARTPPFHGGDTGSNPVRATTESSTSCGAFLFTGV